LWDAIIDDEANKKMLEEMNHFDEGLSPADLQNPEFLKYHHRRGLNSYLSENYFCKFIYDCQEWASAQHAYQVILILILLFGKPASIKSPLCQRPHCILGKVA
jgi:hypothetical protein